MYYHKLHNNKRNVCSINDKAAGYTYAFIAEYNIKKSENDNAYYTKQFEVHLCNPKLLQRNEEVTLCVSETTKTYAKTRITMAMDELHTVHQASNAATLSCFVLCSVQNLWARYSKVNQYPVPQCPPRDLVRQCPVLQFPPSRLHIRH